MKARRKRFARMAGAAMVGILVAGVGCEQIIGLDGPYIADPGGVVSGECNEGAVEACYSGDPALEGIGACQPGSRICTQGVWGACTGEGAPSIEACAGNDDDCNGNAVCTGELGWVLSFGGPGNDGSTAVAADAESNVIVAGSFDKPGVFGGAMLTPVGNADMVVFKLDPTGQSIWSKSFGSSSADYCRGLGVDANGNVVVVGVGTNPIDFGGGPVPQSNTTIFVAKLDPSGNHVWSRSFTGASTVTATDATVDAAGNVLISSTITGAMDFGSGLQTGAGQNESLAVVKLDATGKNVFAHIFNSAKCCGNLRSAITTDDAGNVAVAGNFVGTMTIGNFMVTSAQKDVFLAKLSPTGEALWVLQGTASGDSTVNGLASDHTGAFIVSGSFTAPSLKFGSNTIQGYASTDAFVVKFDNNGIFSWGKAFGNGGDLEVGSEVEADDANNISFTGNTNSNALDLGTGPLGPAGMFVAKLDPTGNPIWAKMTDSATTPYPDAKINVDKQGHTLMTRGFVAPMSFGGKALPAYGQTDLFVIKLGP